jgi:glutaredoxin
VGERVTLFVRIQKARRDGSRRRVVAAALALALWLGTPGLAVADAGCRVLEVYTQPGCPHCAAAEAFLADLAAARPELEVRVSDVTADADALARLRRSSTRHGVKAGGVPAFEACGRLLVGFDDAASSGPRVVALLDETLRDDAPVRVPLLGELDPREQGLPLFTLALGLIDGFNPCAMWVLLVLLSVLVNVKDRRKLLIVAGTFVVVSGLAYFAFMAAWLNVFLLVGFSRATQVLLGAVAVGMSLFHLKDFVAFGRGPSLSIPESAKPGIYRRVRDIVQARSLTAALVGAIVLAVLVNVVELLCTAGLPALYTRILTLRPLSTAAYYGYLALYNLAYMADDLVMVTLVVVTLERFKLQERAGRWLKGLSGLVMLLLGLVLLLRPEWLTI